MGKIKCVRHYLIKRDRHLLDTHSVQKKKKRKMAWCIVGKLAFMCNPQVEPLVSGKRSSSHYQSIACTHGVQKLLQKYLFVFQARVQYSCDEYKTYHNGFFPSSLIIPSFLHHFCNSSSSSGSYLHPGRDELTSDDDDGNK